MSEFITEQELLSRDSISGRYAEMREQGLVAALSEPTQDEVFDAVQMALMAPVRETHPCGCVQEHGSFTSFITVEQRAQVAVQGFAAGYEYLQTIGPPEKYLDFVQQSELIPAMVTIGCLTAELEERGRMLREKQNATSFTLQHDNCTHTEKSENTDQ